MSFQRAVVFTGLIRNRDNLKQLLAFQKRHAGQPVDWVISTWNDEYETFRSELEVALKRGFRVVLCDPPILVGHGYAYNQKLSLFNALSCLSDDAYVFKGRIDFLNLTWLEEFLTAKPQPVDARSVYSFAVTSHSYFLTQPFYVNDIFFVGMKKDLLKLCVLDVVTLDFMPRMGVEQLFHTAPFLGTRGWLIDYMRINPGLMIGNAHGTDAMARDVCEDPYFLSVIAAYLGEMVLNYTSFYPQAFPDCFNGLGAYDFLCAKGEGFDFNAGSAMKLAVSVEVPKALARRKIDDSSLGYLASQLNAYLRDEMSIPHDKRSGFVKLLQKHLPDAYPQPERGRRNGAHAMTRLQRSSDWQIYKEDQSFITKLQNEISELRRALEKRR